MTQGMTPKPTVRLRPVVNALATALVVTGLTALQGCALPEVEPAPTPALPGNWTDMRSAAAASAVAVAGPLSAAPDESDAPWSDPVLQSLLLRAQGANRELRLSAYRIDLAIADARIAGLQLEPQLSLGASAYTGRALPGSTNRLGWTNSSGVTFSASWEVDLWGRLRGQARQAGQAAEMAVDDQRALRWDLQAKVAEQYWSIARLQAAQIRLADDQRAADETSAARRLMRELGTIRPGDVDASVADARALALQRESNVLMLETARRALAALVDAAPQDFPLPQARLPRERASLPAADAPMQLLDGRPDVHHARVALDQALLGERIARVNRYPTLTLSPSIATGGTGWRHLLDDPGFSLGLGLGLPFVDWRARGLAQTEALTHKEMAAVQFRDALWLALADVAQRQEDFALSIARLSDAQGQVVEAGRAVATAQARLVAGIAAPQELRDAQRGERAAVNREDDAWQAHWVAWLAVRRAVGGGVRLDAPARAPS